MKDRISYDMITGGKNADEITNDQNFTDAIEIKNPTSANDMLIFGIQIRFPDGAEDAEVQIKDSSQNILISGNVQLSQIGNRSKADILRDELPVKLLLKVGTTIIVSLKPATGKTIAKEKVNVTLFGKNPNLIQAA